MTVSKNSPALVVANKQWQGLFVWANVCCRPCLLIPFLIQITRQNMRQKRAYALDEAWRRLPEKFAGKKL
jgi:hypothetical protein